VDDPCPCGRTGPRLTRIMGRADEVTKVKGMFVHPSQVQKVIDSHPEIAKGRLLVDRHQETDSMTLEIELKGEVPEGIERVVEETIREVIKMKGSVRIVAPGSLANAWKTIEDVRKWD